MSKLIANSVLMSVAACLLVACGGTAKPIPSKPDKPDQNLSSPIGSTACQEPRPEICTQQYLPVCGYWFEGPACKPGMVCPAIALIKKKTYSNSCSACSDKKVNGFKKGECPT